MGKSHGRSTSAIFKSILSPLEALTQYHPPQQQQRPTTRRTQFVFFFVFFFCPPPSNLVQFSFQKGKNWVQHIQKDDFFFFFSASAGPAQVRLVQTDEIKTRRMHRLTSFGTTKLWRRTFRLRRFSNWKLGLLCDSLVQCVRSVTVQRR